MLCCAARLRLHVGCQALDAAIQMHEWIFNEEAGGLLKPSSQPTCGITLPNIASQAELPSWCRAASSRVARYCGEVQRQGWNSRAERNDGL